MQIKDIFTNFLAIDFLNVDNAVIEKFCYEEKNKNAGRILSNYGGWQSNNVVNAPELITLVHELNSRLSTIHKHFGFSSTKHQVITDIWININSTHDFNLVHKHPGCFFAGVYYVKANNDSGELMFMNPNNSVDYVITSDMCEQSNGFNSSTWWEGPWPGKVVIFPGWINHYVKPNRSNEDRISIAFNTSIV